MYKCSLISPVLSIGKTLKDRMKIDSTHSKPYNCHILNIVNTSRPCAAWTHIWFALTCFHSVCWVARYKGPVPLRVAISQKNRDHALKLLTITIVTICYQLMNIHECWWWLMILNETLNSELNYPCHSWTFNDHLKRWTLRWHQICAPRFARQDDEWCNAGVGHTDQQHQQQSRQVSCLGKRHGEPRWATAPHDTHKSLALTWVYYRFTIVYYRFTIDHIAMLYLNQSCHRFLWSLWHHIVTHGHMINDSNWYLWQQIEFLMPCGVNSPKLRETCGSKSAVMSPRNLISLNRCSRFSVSQLWIRAIKVSRKMWETHWKAGLGPLRLDSHCLEHWNWPSPCHGLWKDWWRPQTGGEMLTGTDGYRRFESIRAPSASKVKDFPRDHNSFPENHMEPSTFGVHDPSS